MFSSKSLFLVAAAALSSSGQVAGLLRLRRTDREQAGSTSKGSSTALTDKIMMNGEMVFGADLEKGSKDVGTCYKTSRVDPLESVEVCGVNMKVIVYLPNDCLQADPHNVEVGTCDVAKDSTSCVSINGDKKGDTYWIDSALSYKILPCDVSGEAPVDDAPPINTTDLVF